MGAPRGEGLVCLTGDPEVSCSNPACCTIVYPREWYIALLKADPSYTISIWEENESSNSIGEGFLPSYFISSIAVNYDVNQPI